MPNSSRQHYQDRQQRREPTWRSRLVLLPIKARGVSDSTLVISRAVNLDGLHWPKAVTAAITPARARAASCFRMHARRGAFVFLILRHFILRRHLQARVSSKHPSSDRRSWLLRRGKLFENNGGSTAFPASHPGTSTSRGACSLLLERITDSRNYCKD